MNYSKKHWIPAVALSSLLALVIGCGSKPTKPTTPTTPALKPVNATLSANPGSIQRGQSATLTWSTDNATNITLDGTPVNANGSQTVSPTDTTTYHLSATGAGGTQEAVATVNVAAPTPTPAPTTPSLTDEQLFDQSVRDVYFDYDSADLRPESQQALATAARLLNAHPNWRVQIEGNCDERGSEMYNLTLGGRRANSAFQALTQGGVNATQLKTITYGKEKPVCNDASEDCWQKNRHDHFVLTQH